ncbi:MAG: hypothetical protein J1E62_08455 [Lachnospiraceae bacterium]|nr:hypothetical protein [Lachnospiraceae bacterium]
MDKNYCKTCNMIIADKTDVCLFCGRVLTKGDDENPVNMYPAIYQRTRMAKRIVWIATFVLIFVQVLLFLFNYYLDRKGIWSYITGVSILYTIILLHYMVLWKRNYIRKLFMVAFYSILLLLALDGVTGFPGWSVRYGLPCSIFALDGILFIGMLVDRANWTSYLLVQVFALILGVVNLVLYLCGVAGSALLVWLAFLLTILLFGGSMLVGARKAESELRRRFYI